MAFASPKVHISSHNRSVSVVSLRSQLCSHLLLLPQCLVTITVHRNLVGCGSCRDIYEAASPCLPGGVIGRSLVAVAAPRFFCVRVKAWPTRMSVGTFPCKVYFSHCRTLRSLQMFSLSRAVDLSWFVNDSCDFAFFMCTDNSVRQLKHVCTEPCFWQQIRQISNQRIHKKEKIHTK